MIVDFVYAHGVQSRSRMIAVDFAYAHVVYCNAHVEQSIGQLKERKN